MGVMSASVLCHYEMAAGMCVTDIKLSVYSSGDINALEENSLTFLATKITHQAGC